MIDSHFHVWAIDRGDYAWLDYEDAVLRRDYSVDDWSTAAADTPVSVGVLVQAAPTAAETNYIVTVAQERPDVIVGVVAWADLTAEDAPEQVDALSAESIVVGVRPWLQAIADPDWILSPAVGRGVEALKNRGLVYEALIRPVHLSRIGEIVRRHPGLRVVVDHAAKPHIADDAFEPWATDLRRLASAGDVYCKLSGLLTEAGSRVDLEALRRYVETVLEAFGPQRVLWGSDWPVVSTVAGYPSWLAMARELVPDDLHDQVFAGTARAVYGLPSTTAGPTQEQS